MNKPNRTNWHQRALFQKFYPVLKFFLLSAGSHCPKTGDGVHQWIFSAALDLSRLPASFAAKVISLKTAGCGRVVTQKEIWDAVSNSRNTNGAMKPASGSAHQSLSIHSNPVAKWPNVDHAEIKRITRSSSIDEQVIRGASPFKDWGHRSQNASLLLRHLFATKGTDPLVCLGCSPTLFSTQYLSKFEGAEEAAQFVVPSPMSATFGRRKSDGKRSARTDDNTGPRRFLVTEFDGMGYSEQLSVIWHLKSKLPLSLIVFSGGESFHAWFFCEGVSHDDQRKFMAEAVSLGADKAMWTKSQMTRMPFGLRPLTGKDVFKSAHHRVQEALYFDPAASI